MCNMPKKYLLLLLFCYYQFLLLTILKITKTNVVILIKLLFLCEILINKLLIAGRNHKIYNSENSSTLSTMEVMTSVRKEKEKKTD